MPQWVMLNLFGSAAEQFGPAAWIAGLAFGGVISLVYALRQSRMRGNENRDEPVR